MATVVFAETLDTFQHSTRLIPESSENLRIRNAEKTNQASRWCVVIQSAMEDNSVKIANKSLEAVSRLIWFCSESYLPIFCL
jgi:hypothetical protein